VYARVSVQTDKAYGITNEGFRGMGIRKGNEYNFSVWARLNKGENGNIVVQLVTAKGEKLGEGKVSIAGNEWKKYSVSFKSSATELRARSEEHTSELQSLTNLV